MVSYPSIDALSALVDSLPAGAARREQLGMVRAELSRGLVLGTLPTAAQGGLRQLLTEDTLRAYVRAARTGLLRSRKVGGARPPTSAATNTARLSCLDALREAAGLPVLDWGDGEPVVPRPTPADGQLAALRLRLGEDLAAALSPGQARFCAVIAMELDTAARSGELVEQRVPDLAPGHTAVQLVRRPQNGSAPDLDGEQLPLSALSREALARWLPVRAELVERAHGTTTLWVSLRPNHDGDQAPAGAPAWRPAGMPLEERGLIRSYGRGRHEYGLTDLLPPKLEQLRRAVQVGQPAP
jgi:hypothetical protein